MRLLQNSDSFNCASKERIYGINAVKDGLFTNFDKAAKT